MLRPNFLSLLFIASSSTVWANYTNYSAPYYSKTAEAAKPYPTSTSYPEQPHATHYKPYPSTCPDAYCEATYTVTVPYPEDKYPEPTQHYPEKGYEYGHKPYSASALCPEETEYPAPEYPHKPEYPHEPDYSHKPEYPQKPNYPQTPEHPEYPDNPKYPDEPDYPPHKPGYPAKPEYPSYPNKPEYPHKPDYTHKPDSSGYPYKPEYPHKTEYPQNPDYTQKPEYPGYPYKSHCPHDDKHCPPSYPSPSYDSRKPVYPIAKPTYATPVYPHNTVTTLKQKPYYGAEPTRPSFTALANQTLIIPPASEGGAERVSVRGWGLMMLAVAVGGRFFAL